jgi:hypothetical protein
MAIHGQEQNSQVKIDELCLKSCILGGNGKKKSSGRKCGLAYQPLFSQTLTFPNPPSKNHDPILTPIKKGCKHQPATLWFSW